MFEMSRGRNKELIARRNEALIRRYLYWTEEKRLRFDDTLKVLSEQEFFISEDTVIGIIKSAARQSKIHIPQKPKTPPLTPRMRSLFDR